LTWSKSRTRANDELIYIFFFKEEEEREEITPELVARLVTRPEDLPQNVAASIKKYRDMMLRTLEVVHTYQVLFCTALHI